ncbi:hypothetical protein ACTFIR_001125 [Dictyostelium discoideum]
MNHDINRNNQNILLLKVVDINKNEKLFWKVLRNIYLNSKIFNYIKIVNDSFNKFKIGIFKYYEINSTEWMIENGHLNLLRDKIINSNNLSFYCNDSKQTNRKYDNTNNYNNQSGHNKYYKYSIFNVFKDDVEFFKCLIKNYPLYYQPPYTTNEDLERFSLEYDNLALMIILVEQYKYKPSIKSLERSIDIASINVANYLYKILILNNSNNNNTSSPIKEINYKLSFWKLALNYDNNNYNYNNDFKNLNKKVDLLINKFKLELPMNIYSLKNNSLNSFFRLFNILIYQETIESIIECCKTVIYLKQLLEPIIEKLKLSTITTPFINGQSPLDNELSNSYEWLTIEQINEIENSFKEIELKETLFGETKISDNRLMKLFNMLIIFTPPPQSGEDKLNKNYQFYRFKYFRQFKEETKSLLIIDNSSDFGYFINYDNNSNNNYNNYNNDLQFKYCKNDIDIIIKFFKNSINDIIQRIKILKKEEENNNNSNNNNYNNNNIKIIQNGISNLLSYCSKIDNLELLQFTFNQIYQFYNKITLLQFNLYSSFKCLDFIIKFSKSINESIEKLISNLFIFNNIELLYYVKENYEIELIEFLEINFNKLKNSYSFEICKFFIECLNSLNFNNNNNNNNYSFTEIDKETFSKRVWELFFQGNIDFKDLQWLINITPKFYFHQNQRLCDFIENKLDNYKNFELVYNLLLLDYKFTISLTNKVKIKIEYINHFNNNNYNYNKNNNKNNENGNNYLLLNSLINNYDYNFLLNEILLELIKRNDINFLIELIELKKIKTIENIFKRIIIILISSGKIQFLESIFSSNKIIEQINTNLANQFLRVSFEKGNIESLLFLAKKFKNSHPNSSIKTLSFFKIFFKNNLFIDNNNYFIKKHLYN